MVLQTAQFGRVFTTSVAGMSQNMQARYGIVTVILSSAQCRSTGCCTSSHGLGNDDLTAAGAMLPELEHSSTQHFIAMTCTDCSVEVCMQPGKRQS